MSRSVERKLIMIMGVWQIIEGLITIFYYGLYKYGWNLGNQSSVDNISKAIHSNLFTVTTTFGILLISLGLINFLISHRYLKDNQIHKKIGIYLIIQVVFSYIVFDLISVVLGVSAAVILLSKNKSVKKHQIRNGSVV